MAFKLEDLLFGIGWTVTPDPETSPGPYHFRNTAGLWIIEDISTDRTALKLIKKGNTPRVLVIPLSLCSFQTSYPS